MEPHSACPVCSTRSRFFTTVSGFDYFECPMCKIIHIDASVIEEIDGGRALRSYDNEYWSSELEPARQRARCAGIARLSEAIFLCCRSVDQVIDIGTGAGFLLDEISTLLPNNTKRIWGVELFPPPQEHRTTSSQFVVGTMSTISNKRFDAGLCMEVVEHLSPRTVRGLLKEISQKSNEGACYLVNTALVDFVKTQDPGYLDPLGRGHIISYTVDAFNILGEHFGLRARAIPGRSYAFLLENTTGDLPDIEHRIWNPNPSNLQFLCDGRRGESVLATLAQQSLLASYLQSELENRTRWATSLNDELAGLRRHR